MLNTDITFAMRNLSYKNKPHTFKKGNFTNFTNYGCEKEIPKTNLAITLKLSNCFPRETA